MFLFRNLNYPYLLRIDFANALTNPMKYFSEKEKRAKQLEVLMIDDQEKDNADSPTNNLPKDTSINGGEKPVCSVCYDFDEFLRFIHAFTTHFSFLLLG